MPQEPRKPKILLVDDEQLLLNLYSVKFLHAGYDVFITTSTLEAITAIIKGYVPDVILFDITMPGYSGFEFIEAIRERSELKHTLKIALTNESQEGDIARTKELGADMHIVKAQFTPAELVVVVTSELTKKGFTIPSVTSAQ